MQVVWFKRDLRWSDHAPLAHAARAGPVVALYVREPEMVEGLDCARQHVAFVDECLAELDEALQACGNRLVRRTGEMTRVLTELLAATEGFALWSHEETGNAVTFERDRRVGRWCRANGVVWREFAQHGVVRGLRDRDGWAHRWDARMSEPVIETPRLLARAPGVIDVEGPAFGLRVPGLDKPLRQRGGRRAGLDLLNSFLDGRGRDYRRAMSSPISAENACSRLSPHLAFGTVSIREAAQSTWARRSALQALAPEHGSKSLLGSLKSFEGRLHWHCHFIQKLESEPGIEFENMHRGYDGLRTPGERPEHLAAWCEGRSGYPMVDACMRMLAATGWINFRMRAMLMSFASYHLWLHWRDSGLHLAREFLDYEPGVHWSQSQMQSGTTGINTLRIYSPVKQARDHDPEGAFVRRWVPELAGMATSAIFEPWKSSPGSHDAGGVRIGTHYPAPIVDHATAVKEARDRIWAVRQRRDVADEALAVYRRHGSRNPAREGVRRGEASSAAKRRAYSGDDPAQASLEFGDPTGAI